ncbi:MAG: phage terminase small subunit-related protein [Flavobacteriales bacterium]
MAEKRRTAQQLYVRNSMQGQEIAALLDVSEKTISKWKIADNWDRQRAAMVTTKPQELQRMYAQLSELNTAIEQRDPGKRYANSLEADVINKLASAIKKLEDETGLSATVNAFIAFIDWLRKKDLDKAKEFGELADHYIKHLAS